MSVYAGLDGGSTYLKAALIDQSGRVLRTGVKSTGIDNNGGAKDLLQQLCREAGVPAPDYTMATGYSRKILEVADDDVSEITAHAYGVRITAPQGYRPGLIVDIGYLTLTGGGEPLKWIMGNLVVPANNNVASFYEKHKKTVDKFYEKLNEKFIGLN